MRSTGILRQAFATVKVARPVPEARGTVKSPAEFLNAIGRDAPKKLSAPLSSWEKWEDMWAVDGDKLKSAGVGVKDRRYFLWCLEKYRLGGDPTEFAIKAKPKKKFRGWGPKVQHGKRVR
ncbi:Vacuolar fusion protein mon1 [Tulasnella sp. 330]|nr:Vacuolar fusion protein mon1 [Tulasnella sp. 330]KAG8876708.1 Vacuolar fusion protein mon1 [Tulasnella sp. 331]KAG8887367.1 Vacuolar fusion protein mon1 [Tulasnella sp. 332]